MSLPKANEPMPSATGTHRERGNASFRAGQYAEAEQHYTAALIDCAEDYRHLLHSNRAAARIDTGDFDGALVDARACMQLDPTFAKGFFRAGQALERLGRRAEAREVYRDGIAVCDASPATRHLKEALSDASPAGGTEPPLEQLDTLIEDWADKGRVTIATRDFLPGEIIMTEKPLLVWQGDPISRTVISSFKHFLKAFADASVPTQEAVLDMYHELSLVDDCDLAQVTSFAVLQPDQIKILMATKATNAHDFGGEEHQGALFARGSLISHSCRPNANYSNHATPGKQRHTAIRPIAAGEEVTVSYGVGFGDKSALWATSTPERRQYLRASKGFVCGCQRCTEPDLPQEHYDTIKRNRAAMDTHAKFGETVKELKAAFTCICAAECAAARCGEAFAPGSHLFGCNHPAVFEMQKPAFHAGEAFAKIYAQTMGAPQFNGDGILNEFHMGVEKYLPVVAQWLGTTDADYQSIQRAICGWQGHAAFAPVVLDS